MSKTADGTHLLPTLDEADKNGRGLDRLTKVIQVVLALYLLPALAIVLLFGFAMIAIGAIARVVARVARFLCSTSGTSHRPEPLVSGAWIYRVGSGTLPNRWHSPQPVTQGGWIRRPESDVLN